jgi:hypothetical protein
MPTVVKHGEEIEVVYCRNCVLSNVMDGVRLDESGLCNVCKSAISPEKEEEIRQALKEDFEKRVQEIRGRSSFDVVVGWSGGKDSTYTVAMLKEQYGLRVLGFNFDNGFTSPTAMQNLFRVSEKLGVDLVIVKPPFDLMKKVFGGTVENDNLYPGRALHRASAVCNSCMGLAKFIALRMALEKNIPMVAFGWTPGQAAGKVGSLFKVTPEFARMQQVGSYKPLYGIAGDAINPYFLEEEHFAMPVERFPYNVSPLSWIEYDEEAIKEHIKQYGWEKPQDTDPNSTNCLLNTFANVVHIRQKGFNPYAMELASLVRKGKLERAEAIRRLETKEDPATFNFVAQKLGQDVVEKVLV